MGVKKPNGASQYDGTDAKPIGTYSRSQIISLEHKWRIKLKESGFSDIEKWDNKPRQRMKKIKFIKGHIRLQRYKTLRRFMEAGMCRFEYFRALGLFAHHAPPEMILPQYRPLMFVVAEKGYLPNEVLKRHPKVDARVFSAYLRKKQATILQFVREFCSHE